MGVPNANYMNMRLLQKVTDIYKVYDDLEDADYYTCSQLLAIIEERIKGGEPKTFRDVVEEFVQNLRHHLVKRFKLAPYWSSGFFLISHFSSSCPIFIVLNTYKLGM